MRHIVVMTAASTASLLAIFLVDLVDMFFLSLLGEVELAAAIGYAGSILFFTTAVCIGLSIASGALAARALGAGDREQARRFVVNAYVGSVMITLPVAVAIWLARNSGRNTTTASPAVSAALSSAASTPSPARTTNTAASGWSPR